MTGALALFAVSAMAAIVGALFTVLAKNPIRSAVSLLLSIAGVAGLFLGLHAEFLATIEILVYAGAVVVLFVFVIMLIGPSAVPSTDARLSPSRWLGAVLLAAGGILAAYVSLKRTGGQATVPPPTQLEHGTIDAFGRELFTRGLVPFELATALFVVAVVGAIALAQGRGDRPMRGPSR